MPLLSCLREDIAPNAPEHIYNENGEFTFEPYRIQNISAFPFQCAQEVPARARLSLFVVLLIMAHRSLCGLTLSAKAGYMCFVEHNCLLHACGIHRSHCVFLFHRKC